MLRFVVIDELDSPSAGPNATKDQGRGGLANPALVVSDGDSERCLGNAPRHRQTAAMMRRRVLLGTHASILAPLGHRKTGYCHTNRLQQCSVTEQLGTSPRVPARWPSKPARR